MFTNAPIQLDTDGWQSMAHHLRIAAARYRENARTVREGEFTTMCGADLVQLARTFDQQAVQAEHFADQIERTL